MIDTIKLHLKPDYILNDYIDFLIDKFPKLKTITTEDLCSHSCMYKNLKIEYSQHQGFKISNSLSVYKFGNNQPTLNLTDIINIIEELSLEFELPLINSKVLRLDIAENIITTHPTDLYIDILESATFFNKSYISNTLYFENTNRSMVFYDKIKEQKKKKEKISTVLNNKNVLRFEYRYLKHQNLANYLGIKEVLVSDVIENYQKIVDAWQDMFTSINKNHQLLTFKPEVFTKKGAFKKQIKLLGIAALGGEREVMKIIKNAKAQGLFKYANGSTNEKSWVKGLMKSPGLTEKLDLAKELELKVQCIRFLNSEQQSLSYLIENGIDMTEYA